MSIVYEAIKNLNFTKEEKNSLRTFFISNPDKRAEAELILPTCDDEEVVTCLKNLLKPEQPDGAERKVLYFQYNDSKVIPESYNSWTNFRELFVHLQTLFGLEASMMDYEFAIGNKKVDLTLKKDFIELVEQNRISFGNPIKILDVKGYGSYAEIIDGLPTPSKMAEPSEWHKHNSNRPVCLNHRPPTATNIVPVSLYCSVFGRFEDLCKEDPKREDNAFTYNFCREMARFYPNEEARRSTANRLLSEYLKHGVEPLSLENNRSTDGTVSTKNSYREINIEYKNETCSTNACPYLENCGYYLLFCKKQEKDASPATNIPCFLITIAGPTFAVYGAIFSDIAIVDPLTTTFHLFWLKNNEKMMIALSSTFRALKLSLQELDDYYGNVPQIFPRQYPSFPNVDIFDVSYNIQVNSQYGNYLLWQVTLQEANNILVGRKAYVKAVQEKDYSLEVHQFLANDGYAPTIISSMEIPGGWLLIYMECLDHHLMLDQITHTLNGDGERNSLRKKITEVVDNLHESNYVHGDLREGNILVCRDKNNDECGFDVKFIDFEWSGVAGTARYPHFMNHINIKWPVGADDGEKVTVEHDNYMLGETFRKTNLLPNILDMPGHF